MSDDFERYIERSLECWRWLGSYDPGGYGRLSKRLAHRLTYERFVGPIPAEMQVHHLCENKWCVNPSHMEIATPKRNSSARAESVEWKRRIKRWHYSGEWESRWAYEARTRRKAVA